MYFTYITYHKLALFNVTYNIDSSFIVLNCLVIFTHEQTLKHNITFALLGNTFLPDYRRLCYLFIL